MHQFSTLQAVQHVFRIILCLPLLIRFLDATPRRGVVMGDGQTNHRTVRQIDGTLYQSFTIGTATHHKSTVMVLYGSCHDLSGRRRIAVYQDDNLSFLKETVPFCAILITRGTPPLRIDYQIIIPQKLIGDGNSCMEITTAILLQVKDKRLHPLTSQFHETLAELLMRLGAEITNTDIADTRTYHISGINRLDRYLITSDDKFQGIGNTPADNSQTHLRPFRTAQSSHNLFLGHRDTRYRSVIHIDDTVTGKNTLFLRGTSNDRLDNEQCVLHHIKLHTDTLKVPLQRFVRLFHLFSCHITAMRIHLLYHPPDTVLHEFLLIDTVHIEIRDCHLRNLQFTQRAVLTHVDTYLGMRDKGE